MKASREFFGIVISMMFVFVASSQDLFADSTQGISEVKMVDVFYYKDGGTTGFEVEVNGVLEHFCLDGRMGHVDREHRHVFLNATHPSHQGAIKVQIGSAEEVRVLAILNIWLDAELSHSVQHLPLEGDSHSLTIEETKIQWALKVRDILRSRNVARVSWLFRPFCVEPLLRQRISQGCT